MKVFGRSTTTPTGTNSSHGIGRRRSTLRTVLLPGLVTGSIALIVLLGACQQHRDTQPTRVTPSTAITSAQSAPAGVAPAPITSGRLNAQEITWLNAVQILADQLIAGYGQPTGGELTSAAAREIAGRLHQCTPGLAGVGAPPTQRLQPVYDVFKAGCDHNDQAAGCYLTISDLPKVLSESQARKMSEAFACAGAAATEGARNLAQVYTKSADIKLSAGYL